jgi:hypothetical protein
MTTAIHAIARTLTAQPSQAAACAIIAAVVLLVGFMLVRAEFDQQREAMLDQWAADIVDRGSDVDSDDTINAN